jgi:hypothetical protein
MKNAAETIGTVNTSQLRQQNPSTGTAKTLQQETAKPFNRDSKNPSTRDSKTLQNGTAKPFNKRQQNPSTGTQTLQKGQQKPFKSRVREKRSHQGRGGGGAGASAHPAVTKEEEAEELVAQHTQRSP